MAFIDRATPPSGAVRSEFNVHSTLMGPGAARQVAALIVPPASPHNGDRVSQHIESQPTHSGSLGRLTSFEFRHYFYVDLLLVSVAAVLPWSTTAVDTLMVVWLLALIPLAPSLDLRAFLQVCSSPTALAPIALVVLAAVGTLWADAPWHDRLRGFGPVGRLLIMPLLFYHFQRSPRGMWVFAGFLISCSLLLVLSWIVLFFPALKPAVTASDGVPVKNYIDQSQEFSLCLLALLPVVMMLFRQRRYWAAGGCAALVAGFLANMAFVASARAALLYLPVLLVLFAFTHLARRTAALLLVATIVLGTVIGFSSPYLKARFSAIAIEYHEYELNIPASTGRRLEYWQKSLGFIAESWVFGHGTGATKTLFAREAEGKTGLAGEVTPNPHNQTLNVAIQWGLAGVVVLYAMWLSHLFLFRGESLANWIGLLVVAQNMLSSLLNSHLFDTVEGWIYVIGVGVAGGVCLTRDSKHCTEQQ